ncbi:hypothetical protein VTO42DRAFT_1793 [Malbranchea cinnamomea]
MSCIIDMQRTYKRTVVNPRKKADTGKLLSCPCAVLSDRLGCMQWGLPSPNTGDDGHHQVDTLRDTLYLGMYLTFATCRQESSK